MPDDLSIQGDLSETTVPDLFRSLIRSGETAIVTLQTAGRSDEVYFHEGKIVRAASTDPDMALGEVLLRSGELNLQQYDQAMERLVTSHRMGALLCELGFLQADGLIRAQERQASAVVINAMSYREGGYTISFTETFPEEMLTLPLSTERLVLDGIHSIEHWSLILRGIGRLERILEQVPGADARAYHLELTEEEAHMLSLLSEPQSVEMLCARSYLPNFVSCRTLWGLLTVNLARDAEEAGTSERKAAEATEYELEGLIESYNTVFQRIFYMLFQKIGDHVYDFVDRVVAHLPSETMPYLSGMSLVNEARIDVDQLLTNVVASGSRDHAAVVGALLDELLYGWIYEVKSEFGSELESEIVGIARTLKK